MFSWPVLGILGVILAITAGGIARTMAHKQQEAEARLHAIADLKASQISDWLEEKLGDARFIQTSPYFAEQYRDWSPRGDEAARDRLTSRLEQLRNYRGFSAVSLVDPNGARLWGSDKAPAQLAPPLPAAVAHGRDGQIQRVGPYVGVAGHRRLDFLVPLPVSEGLPPMVVVHVDPAAWLYPMLQTWPVPSASGETLLFRRDGERVQFLNDLRHRRDTAVIFQLPVSNADLLAAQVLSGRTDMKATLRGVDYRRVPVLGTVRAIPDTDWYLVAKVDRAEVYAEAFRDAVWMGLTGTLALFIILASLVLLRQRRRLAAAEHAHRAETERVRALKLLESFAESSDDAIFAKDLEGRYILFNRAAGAFVGKPVQEVLGRDDRDLFPPDQAEQIVALDRQAIRDNRIRTEEEVLDTPQGTRIFLATKGPLRDEHDQVIGTFGISRDITGHKRAEAAIRESEARFRALVEQSLAGIYIIQEGRFRYVNPGFAAIFGYDSPEAIVGMATDTLVAPGDRERVSENVRRRVEGELADILYVFRGLRRDGSTIDVEVHGRAFDYEGQPAVIGLILDITARKAAEDALRASELRFHDIVNASADWVWEVDAQGRFTYASESVQGLLGHSAAAIMGKTPFDLMPADEGERVRAVFADIAARKAPFRDLENINLHKDGSLRYILSNGMPILDEAGRLLGYRGLDRDVTERRLAEMALRESDARWIMAIGSAGHGVWDWNTATDRVFFSPTWKALLGYGEGEIGDSLEEWSGRVHPEDIARCQAELQRHFRGESETYICEHRMRCKDGSYKWILDQGRTVARDADGRPTRMIGTHTDISHTKAAGEELRRQSTELAERNAELERFNRATVDRELDMIALKRRINALSGELGREPPFDLSFAIGAGGEKTP